MGVEIEEIDLLVLSHGHYDQTELLTNRLHFIDQITEISKNIFVMPEIKIFKLVAPNMFNLKFSLDSMMRFNDL